MDYEMIKVRTALNDDGNYSGLSFVEGEHDIPFAINRMYFIYKSEEKLQKGFHPHKQSWHLLFCPNGKIEVTVDNGSEKKTILLDSPEKGLIIQPGLWREIVWKDDKSVLCVAASGHYEAEKYQRDYNMYLQCVAERKKLEQSEKLDIFGDM